MAEEKPSEGKESGHLSVIPTIYHFLPENYSHYHYMKRRDKFFSHVGVARLTAISVPSTTFGKVHVGLENRNM